MKTDAEFIKLGRVASININYDQHNVASVLLDLVCDRLAVYRISQRARQRFHSRGITSYNLFIFMFM
jgi:hypothetical protein